MNYCIYTHIIDLSNFETAILREFNCFLSFLFIYLFIYFLFYFYFRKLNNRDSDIYLIFTLNFKNLQI